MITIKLKCYFSPLERGSCCFEESSLEKLKLEDRIPNTALRLGVSKTNTQKRRPKTYKTPWTKTKTLWTKTKTIWTKRKTPGLKQRPSGLKRRPHGLKRRPSGLKRIPLWIKLLGRFRSVVEFRLGYLIVIMKSITYLFFNRPHAFCVL